jgi:hypothetical protein
MTTEKTAVALRVLTAVNRKEEPDPKDVVLLRAYCPERRAHSPLPLTPSLPILPTLTRTGPIILSQRFLEEAAPTIHPTR